MRERLRRLLRRRPYVLVDEDAYRQLCGRAVVGAAIEIIAAESDRWHNLDTEERQS